MIDVHSHVPTHRDSVPPDELVVNDKWRPDRPVRRRPGPTTPRRSPASRSPSFTIARDRTRVDSDLNDAVAAFVADEPSRRIGFLSIHPEVDGALDELERASDELGLKGIKLGPNYQVFDPLGRRRSASTRSPSGAACRCSSTRAPRPSRTPRSATPTLLMDEIAIRFPELRVVMAHLGHPWQRETIVTIRKHPHVYADVSALFYRPWSFYEGLRLATEWGALQAPLRLGLPDRDARRDRGGAAARVNDPIAGTGLPPVPLDRIEELIERDPLPLLGLERP